MPLVAKNKETAERVDITKIDNPREVLRSTDLVCQYCDGTMFVRGGRFVRWHFYHKVLSPGCPSSGESYEHMAAKAELSTILKDVFDDYTDATLDLEVWIPEIERRADILASFPMGWRVAHEIQLSGISPQELEERTLDYYRAGIDVFWWLGRNGDTVANRSWCRDFFGFYLVINIFDKHERADFSGSTAHSHQSPVGIRDGRESNPVHLHE